MYSQVTSDRGRLSSATMALELVGYWKLEKNENWDEYMAAAGKL